MRESHTPALVEVDASTNITDFVVRNATDRPALVVYRRKVGGRWHDVTAADYLAEVQALAKGLVAAGVRPGDRVGLMSCTRYEWTLTDTAIWFAGAVTVPIYETSSSEQLQWILGDSGAVAVVVESEKLLGTVDQVRGELPGLVHTWVIDRGDLDTLAASGGDVPDDDLELRRTSAGADDLATIIYTSGTTGRPKGCELTHGNFVALTENAVKRIEQVVQAEGASTLLFLPLAHVFARFIQVLCMAGGATMGHTADIKTLLPDLAEFQPTFLLAVPRVFEKIYNSAEQKAEGDGRGKIFRAAADTAIAYSRAQDTGSAGLPLRLRYALFDKLVYPKLRAALGGRAEYAVSGGAPLGERLGHFFRGIGLTVLEGYGLTETTAAVTVNLPEAHKVGTVGRPIPGTAVRVADDGELLFRGGQVFAGYWGNEDATGEALETDGWFHTGDVGEVDDEGFMRITGRKKEILVTAGGKNVAPAVLEDRIRAHALVSQCMVVGDNQPFIAALVTIDPEAFPTWAEAHGMSDKIADLTEDAELRAEIETAIEDANSAVSKAESIRKFTILPDDWTEEGGQLTPSLKLKRSVVMRECREEIEALYL